LDLFDDGGWPFREHEQRQKEKGIGEKTPMKVGEMLGGRLVRGRKKGMLLQRKTQTDLETNQKGREGLTFDKGEKEKATGEEVCKSEKRFTRKREKEDTRDTSNKNTI